MAGKFSTVPIESDTRLLAQIETKLGPYEVLYQKWCWNGITAESIIFADDDISALKDAEVEAVVKASPLINCGSKLTLARPMSGFTFVNFNFEIN
jgi:hypothetical protein